MAQKSRFAHRINRNILIAFELAPAAAEPAQLPWAQVMTSPTYWIGRQEIRSMKNQPRMYILRISFGSTPSCLRKRQHLFLSLAYACPEPVWVK